MRDRRCYIVDFYEDGVIGVFVVDTMLFSNGLQNVVQERLHRGKLAVVPALEMKHPLFF